MGKPLKKTSGNPVVDLNWMVQMLIRNWHISSSTSDLILILTYFICITIDTYLIQCDGYLDVFETESFKVFFFSISCLIYMIYGLMSVEVKEDLKRQYEKINYHSIHAAFLYVRIVSFLTEFYCNNISLLGPVCKTLLLVKTTVD